MKIRHGHSYDAWIIENDKIIADASFCSASALEEGYFVNNSDSDLILAISLDQSKYRDEDSGSFDFQEEYARKVAQMVYEMLRME